MNQGGGYRAPHGLDAEELVDAVAVDGHAAHGRDRRERAHEAVGRQLRCHGVTDRVGRERLAVRVADDDVPVPALLAGRGDEVVQAVAERQRPDHARDCDRGAEERGAERGASSALQRHPDARPRHRSQPCVGDCRAQASRPHRCARQGVVVARSGGAPGGRGGAGDREQAAGESDHGGPDHGHRRPLPPAQAERGQRRMVGGVEGNLTRQRLADEQQRSQPRQYCERQQRDRLEVRGAPNPNTRVERVGSGQDLRAGADELAHRPPECRQIGTAVAEPHRHELGAEHLLR